MLIHKKKHLLLFLKLKWTIIIIIVTVIVALTIIWIGLVMADMLLGGAHVFDIDKIILYIFQLIFRWFLFFLSIRRFFLCINIGSIWICICFNFRVNIIWSLNIIITYIVLNVIWELSRRSKFMLFLRYIVIDVIIDLIIIAIAVRINRHLN